METHELKTWPEYFDDVAAGIKTFEIRINDRDYTVDDLLVLKHWDPRTEHHNGQSILCRIRYIYEGCMVAPGYVCLGIQVMEQHNEPGKAGKL